MMFSIDIEFNPSVSYRVKQKKMGSTRHFNLRCSKCYKKDWLSLHESRRRTRENIETISRVGDAVFCRCRTCGHEYKSSSKAAYRTYGYAKK